MVSVLQNTCGLTLGREKGHFSEKTCVTSKSRDFSRKFERNVLCLFQRFVTSMSSIVGPLIIRVKGRDPFNQNSDRSDRDFWSTSKGGPFFQNGPNLSIEFWTGIFGNFG